MRAYYRRRGVILNQFEKYFFNQISLEKEQKEALRRKKRILVIKNILRHMTRKDYCR